MPRFSKQSKRKLAACHEDLQRLFNEVIKNFDCTIVCGRRGKLEQNFLRVRGRSKLWYPNSKHNKVPSLAVDVAPYISGKGISWNSKQCYFFGGYVMGVAASLGISIRYGGDWDKDKDINDQSFNDLVHFEIM